MIVNNNAMIAMFRKRHKKEVLKRVLKESLIDICICWSITSWTALMFYFFWR